MDMKLPGIVVTGASGFVGRNFLEAAVGKFRLFCLARRSQKEAGIPLDDNIRWTQVDIARWETMRDVIDCIKDHGGADYVLHLAGYYDFSNTENPEYERTNVKGTKNVLKLAQLIGCERFLFASSLAATDFSGSDIIMNEESPLDAKFPYAISKYKGEELMKKYSEWFPVSIIRFAAVFSDWCEYPPLYMFIKTWLSRSWNAKVLGGRGESAITYIHVRDLNRIFFRIIELSENLPRIGTYIASPNGFVTHNELFATTTRYFYGRDIKPIKIPKFIAAPGVMLRQVIGKLIKNPPFERLWMMKYIDKKINVDASYTFQKLGWEPTPRLTVLRRSLFMLEKMKSHRGAWDLRNEAALLRVAQRPNLLIHDIMVELREETIEKIIEKILLPENKSCYLNYQAMDEKLIKWHVTLIYQLITTGVRTRDRMLLRNYAQIISYRRFIEGYKVDEVANCMLSIGEVISDALKEHPEMEKMEQRIYDYITMTFQLAVDEIEDSFERIATQPQEVIDAVDKASILSSTTDLERIVLELEDICQDNPMNAHLSSTGIEAQANSTDN